MSIRDNNAPNPHLKRWCALAEPYPEPKALSPNPYYAMLLLEDYAGAVSELTAINQYLFHYFTFAQYRDLADIEECISIIEMYHLELLADTIQLLGAAPEFRTLSRNAPGYWNTSFVCYGTGVCDRLAADIGAEIAAIQAYRAHQQAIADPNIQALLGRIILDEEHHLSLFRDAYGKYCPG